MFALFCPIAALAVNAVTQVLALRIRRGAEFFRSIVEGFLAGALALVMLELAFAPRGDSLRSYLATAFLATAPTYFALSYCAYNFVQLGQTSIRIRIYSEIASKPSGLSVEEIAREYDDKALTDGRLRRLIESGDLVKRDGRYLLGRKRFLLVSHILFAAKRILLGKGSEFE